MNDKGVCRTAPATPGLLICLCMYCSKASYITKHIYIALSIYIKCIYLYLSLDISLDQGLSKPQKVCLTPFLSCNESVCGISMVNTEMYSFFQVPRNWGFGLDITSDITPVLTSDKGSKSVLVLAHSFVLP